MKFYAANAEKRAIAMKKFYCVISHTHWDREWYMPLSQFRFKLVDLIDRCLDTLEEYPDYVFHLDAQTIVLEDYLKVRPGKAQRLSEEIREGRLIVGPWYLQNDFYLTSGEATVRNLLEGTRLAREFGACATSGYAPDQFGNISQLPQILKGFGIDNFIFGRGYSFYDPESNERFPRKSEFIWRGADGTEAQAIHMTFWYNNAQRFSEDPEKAELLLNVVERLTDQVAATPYRLLMNGVDHLEAQDNLLPILKALDENSKDRSVRQWRLDDYVDAVKDYMADNKVEQEVHEGELRWGGDGELLRGTHSSRVYLKQMNVRAQDMLEAKLEPLYTMLEGFGGAGAYSGDHLRFLWKELMQNHPHDSICACSRDEVHDHMEDNYKRLEEASIYLLNAGLRTAAEHFSFAGGTNPEDYVILAVNPTQSTTHQILELEADLLNDDGLDNFTILDAQGNPADYAVAESQDIKRDLFSPINLPGWKYARRHKIYIDAGEAAPMAAKGWRIVRSSSAPARLENKTHGDAETVPFVMENGEVKVTVHPDGKVDCLYKANGHLAEDCLRWEDVADPGDAYIFFDAGDAPLYSDGFPAAVTVEEDNRFFQKCTVTRTLQLPAEYLFAERKRSGAIVDCLAEIRLTLPEAGPLQIGYRVDNRAKDHRLRLLMGTGVTSGDCFADIPYDVLKRTEDQNHHATMSKTFPDTTFALLQDNAGGVAVASEGEHEFQNMLDGTLAFTVLRATGTITRDAGTLEEASGEQWTAPGNQSLREMSGRFGMISYSGDWKKAGIPVRARQFRVGLLSYCTASDSRKFSGGRTAVQDTALEELFFLPDPVPGLVLRDNESLFTLDGGADGLFVTAVKKAENGQDILLRAVNLSDSEVEGRLSIRGDVGETALSEDGWKFLGKDSVARKFRGKEIVTFRVKR